MMADNFFEKELRKLFEDNPVMDDIRFVGRACIGRLTDTTNVKLRFATMGTHEKYEAIEATVLNRLEGTIDSNTFRFKDILGAKPVNNPNFPNGIMPHIWNGARKGGYEWYGYKPTPADYEQIAEVVDEYMGIFQEQTMSQGQQMV
jgi:hypothetical protein